MAEQYKLVCASENHWTWKEQACGYCIGKKRDFHDKMFESGIDDSEVKLQSIFNRKISFPSKYSILEDHFKQTLPTF